VRAPPPSSPLDWVIFVGGAVGLILLFLYRVLRYADVPGKGWLAFVGLVLSGVWGVWALWNRVSPYSVDTQDDEDATVTLGLDRRDDENDSAGVRR